ncbi:MAG: DUF2207 domain-containing protein [Thermotogae bacterium]|nr:DUF2207 domain-containing protein [Thermotogota bacterium]
MLPLVLASGTCPGEVPECILNYEQTVRIERDASLLVEERITVKAAGLRIKRGIYRDFPTSYRRGGLRYRVSFKVLKVLRDGRPENWFVRRLSNGVRIYIGREDVLLEPGIHTYTLVYRTDRQIGFFEDHDELYWNVTGNGWEFPIARVLAEVILPKGVPPESVRYTAYTGGYGFGGHDYEARIVGGDPPRVLFRTTRPLGPREGLTVVVGWPKGYVREPGRLRRLLWLISDNLSLLVPWLVVVLLLVYYVVAWALVGKDPPKGTVVPLFKPPRGMSPAAVRYALRMGECDHDCLVADLLSLAVKGKVRIREVGEGYTIEVVDTSREGLSEDEAKLLEYLPAEMYVGGNRYNPLLPRLSALLRGSVAKMWGRFFRLNEEYVVLGWLIALLGWFLALVMLLREDGGLMHFLNFGVAVLVGYLIISRFSYYMRAPTRKGRRLLDEVEGFRMFLETAERERLRTLFPKESLPSVFERFLPYAMALDVVETWADKFAEDLRTSDYRPTWYEGRSFTGFTSGRAYARFFGGLSRGMSSAIVSASKPPGSTSGFSGSGGFSGGGGGGGGGGGW